MIIKKIYLEKDNADLIEYVLRMLCEKNISYVLINNKNHAELHFDKFVYKIYFHNKDINSSVIYDDVENKINYSYKGKKSLSYTKFDNNLTKKYRRNDITRDNKNSNCKIKNRRSKIKTVRHKIT